MFLRGPGGEAAVSSITVVIEEPGGESLSLTLSYNGDALESFPVFLNPVSGEPAGETDGESVRDVPHEGKLVQGKVVQRNAAGTPVILSSSAREEASGGDIPPEGMEAEILEDREESGFLLVRVRQGDLYSFVVVTYPQGTETWFDQEGGPLFAITPDKDGRGAEYRHNNQGLISGIQSLMGTWSAAYTGNGLPRYVQRQFPAGEAPGESPAVERYIFQWDEAGRLVRLSGSLGGNPILDCRYSYTLDSRGNWTERRETRMIPQGDRLFPSPGLLVKRTIQYAE
jgi:hypothetical protein